MNLMTASTEKSYTVNITETWYDSVAKAMN